MNVKHVVAVALGLSSLATLAVVVTPGARQALFSTVAANAGGSCAVESNTHGAAGHSAPDPMMSLVCERSCAVKQEVPEGQIVSQPGAKPGQFARCPVSGVVFLVRNDSPAFSKDGKTYVTCCGTCETKLSKNPGRFLPS